MKEYTITRINGTPDWNTVPALQINELHKTPQVDIRAQAQICYDDEALYIHLEAEEKDVRGTYTGLLDEVCEDSCLEFFFSPINGDRRYFNIEMNPNGAMFFGFGSNCDNLVRLICEEPVIKPVVQRTDKGWNVTYSFPFEFVRRFFPTFAPVPGSFIRANCFKCGEKTDPKHFMCWCPVVPIPHAFHNPDCFGTMYFG